MRRPASVGEDRTRFIERSDALRMRRGTTLVLLALTLTLLMPADAFAYVDPGAGSYVFQLALAGGLAILYTLRSYWQIFKAAIRSRVGGAQAPSTSEPPHGVE